MADQSGKTEQPTPKRLDKAREEGRFPASRQLVAAVQFLVFVVLLGAWGGEWLRQMQLLTARLLRSAFTLRLDDVTISSIARDITWQTALVPAQAGASMIAAMVAAQLASTRMGVSLQRLAPDLRRLDPLSRLREIPRQNLPAFAHAVLLTPILTVSVAWLVVSGAGAYFRLPFQSVAAGALAVWDQIDGLLWKAALVLAALGALDFVRQRRRYMKDLRMSKQEIREEIKDAEGNPEMKGRVRRLQRDRARRRMMQEIPTATAVVVNPTHYAVAIRYELHSMAAPLVVAKGKNYLALRIRQRATEHQVPIIENPPLARALYGSADVGQEIPPHLYRAVAEVLAYVYRLVHRN
jgi:flagellar biosynthetic protein FlhB